MLGRAEPGVDAIGEYPGAPALRNSLVEPGEVRQAAAEHDHVRIDEVDDRRQRPREPFLVAGERADGASLVKRQGEYPYEPGSSRKRKLLVRG